MGKMVGQVYGNPARVRYSLAEYLEKKKEWEASAP